MAIGNTSINLIGEEEMGHTPLGRIVSWAVTYGRYIMILTEIVVLLAFISRFSLDRKLTDLNDDVTQKQAIIEANAAFEQDFRVVQNQVAKIQSLLATSNKALSILQTIQTTMPESAFLESLTISGNKVVGNVTVGNPASLTYFISSLQNSPQLTDVDIGDIKQQIAGGIQFQFTTGIK